MALGWYVIDPPTSGASTMLLKKPTAAMTGELPVSGVLALTVPKLAAALAGFAPPSGNIAAAAQKAVASLSGAQAQTATVASVLPKATMASAGQSANLGALTGFAQKANAALAGTVINYGGLTATAQKAVASFAGSQAQIGSMAATLQKASALFADGTAIGASAMTLAKATAALAGFQAQSGVLGGLAKVPVASLGGIEHPMGSLASIAKAPVSALVGGQEMSGTFVAALKKAQAAFTGGQEQAGTAAPTLKKATFAGAQALTPVAYLSKDTLFSPAVTSTSLVYSANLTIPSGVGAVVIALEGTRLSGTPAIDTIIATINGVAMTLISRVDGTGVNFTAVFGMLAPPSGTQPLVITFSGAGSSFRQFVGNTYYYTGGSSFGTPTTAINTSNSFSHTITGPTGVTSSDMVFCLIGSYNSGSYPSTWSHTLRDKSSSAGFYSNFITMDAAGANSIAFAATPNSSSPYTASSFAIAA